MYSMSKSDRCRGMRERRSRRRPCCCSGREAGTLAAEGLAAGAMAARGSEGQGWEETVTAEPG